MRRHVGVWIDHKKAVIVEAGTDTATVVESDVPAHTRFTGGGGYPGSQSSQRGGSEHRSEERNRNALDKYFDQVITAFGHPEALLILGPGEAKHQLADRLGQATTRPQPAVTLETTDKLTDAQIVATVAKHFETLEHR
jgi:hypothetical protein